MAAPPRFERVFSDRLVKSNLKPYMKTTIIPWWKRSIFYQIYLPSFCDSNGDGIGDIRGLLAKLDTLRGGKNALGIDAIWLSPFYPSGGADGGYDVTDYESVDKQFGDLKDFDQLIQSCHDRGIKVIIDWVPNHTSDKHPWFLKSRQSKYNPYRDWYIWRNSKGNFSPPNNWISFFDSVGSAWTYDTNTKEYYLHSFSSHQPDLNWENPSVRTEMYKQLRFWLNRGIDGIRIDSLPVLGKNPSLANNASPRDAWGENNIDWPSVHFYIREIKNVCDEFSRIVIVGEVNLPSFRQLNPYFVEGKLSLALNHAFTGISWNASSYKRILQSFHENCGHSAWPAWYFNNHDCSRFVTRCDDNNGIGDERARAACVLLLTLACTPFIYQGEELGLRDVSIPQHLRFDVIGREASRTPYPWSSPLSVGEGVGFTDGRPWLSAGDEAYKKNWTDLIHNPSSLLTLYKSMISFRRKINALSQGSMEIISSSDDIMAYKRTFKTDCLLILINFENHPCEFSHPALRIISRLITSSLNPFWDKSQFSSITLSPNEAVVLKISNSRL